MGTLPSPAVLILLFEVKSAGGGARIQGTRPILSS